MRGGTLTPLHGPKRASTCAQDLFTLSSLATWRVRRRAHFALLPIQTHPMPAGAPLSPLLLVTALAAGMVSFASPCVLPLVPAYLGFITGRSAEELQMAHGRARLLIVTQGVALVLGLALIFALVGPSASLLGQTLLENLPLLW